MVRKHIDWKRFLLGIIPSHHVFNNWAKIFVVVLMGIGIIYAWINPDKEPLTDGRFLTMSGLAVMATVMMFYSTNKAIKLDRELKKCQQSLANQSCANLSTTTNSVKGRATLSKPLNDDK